MDEFIRNFEEAIDGTESGEIQSNTKYKDLGHWDSMSVLSLLAMIDIKYGKQLGVEDLKTCNTIQDLYTKISG